MANAEKPPFSRVERSSPRRGEWQQAQIVKQEIDAYLEEAKPGSSKLLAFSDLVDEYSARRRLEDARERLAGSLAASSPEVRDAVRVKFKIKDESDLRIAENIVAMLRIRAGEREQTIPGYLEQRNITQSHIDRLVEAYKTRSGGFLNNESSLQVAIGDIVRIRHNLIHPKHQ